MACDVAPAAPPLPPSRSCALPFHVTLSARQVLGGSWGLLYAGSSAGEVLALRWLALVPLRLPAFTALLSNSMWLLVVPSYVRARRALGGAPRAISPRERAWQCAVCAALTGAITILRNVAVNVMPGSVFALLISTSIIFAIALSRAVPGAPPLNGWHIAAVVACVASAGAISGAALFTTTEDVPGANFTLGVPCALGAAFCVALMGVAQEVFQRSWTGPAFDFHLAEMTVASSLGASALVVVFGAATQELGQWAPALAAAAPPGGVAALVAVLAALPLLKLAVRNAKYAVIANANALFFEFVQAAAALLAAIGSVISFREPFGPGFIAALLLLAAAFALYAKAKVTAKKARDAAKAAAAAKGGGAFTVVTSPVAMAAAGGASGGAGGCKAGDSPAAAIHAWGEARGGGCNTPALFSSASSMTATP